MRNMVTEGACEAAHGAVNYAFEAVSSHMSRGKSVKAANRNALFRVNSRKDNNFVSQLGHAIQTGDDQLIKGRKIQSYKTRRLLRKLAFRTCLILNFV